MYEKTRKYLLAALPLIFLSSQILAQKNPRSNSITTRLEAYANNSAPEKVYLQTDRDFYTKGDTIWFKTYLLNGVTHFLGHKSNIIHVELLDTNGSPVIARELYAEKGSSFGDLEIGGSIEEGDYRIRAYTRYMLNDEDPVFFEKEISIIERPMASNDRTHNAISKDTDGEKGQKSDVRSTRMSRPNVRFFPEGGNLVTGLQSEIGLKITDKSGNGIPLKGNIIDQTGTVVNRFETYNFGLGAVHVTPKKGTTYYAEIKIEGILHKYALPRALEKGYVLQLKNRGSQIIIRVSSNTVQGLAGTLLSGHVRGEIFLEHLPDDGGGTSYVIRFPTSKLSDGVAQFTLFDQKGSPICERLTFIDNPENEMDITLKTDRSDYSFRERVDLEISVPGTQEKLLQGDFSVSVALDKSFGERTSSINSWLLLNSDLGNTVEDPNYFFEGDSDNRKILLDILMLTHGWRRFVWKSFLLDAPSLRPVFPPEKGIMVNGTTTAFNDRYRPIGALATLSILGRDIYQEKRPTDAQGRFSFGPLVFLDSVNTIISASPTDQGKSQNERIAVHLDTSRTKVNIDDPTMLEPQKENASIQEGLKREYRDKVIGFTYASRVTALSEVVVRAKKKSGKNPIDEELDRTTAYGTSRNRLFPDSIPSLASGTVFDLLTRVAGVQVTGAFPNQSARIGGLSSLSSSGEPLYTVDGVAVSADIVQGITVNDILFVDVLKGNEAAFYGVRGTNGVVAIYTDRGKRFEDRQGVHPGVGNFVIHGFYRAREFYSPDYSVNKTARKRDDYRTTLYWNPDVVITGKAHTKLDFHTGDVPGKYRVKLEGITNDGRPISGQCSFSVSH